MFKRILSIFICVLIVSFVCVPAFAVETTEGVTMGGLSDFLNDYTTTVPDAASEISTSDLSDDVSEPYIPDDADTTVPDTASESDIDTETTEPVTYYTPEENTETAEEVNKNVGRIAFYFKGLKSDFALIVKNTETKEKFSVDIRENSGYFATIELKPGHYKIVKLQAKSNVVSAGNIKDSDGKRFKEFDVKGGDVTVYNLTCTEIVTLGIMAWAKKRFILILLFVALIIVYLYIKKNKALPGKIGE